LCKYISNKVNNELSSSSFCNTDIINLLKHKNELTEMLNVQSEMLQFLAEESPKIRSIRKSISDNIG
jgi:hypothetical protein